MPVWSLPYYMLPITYCPLLVIVIVHLSFLPQRHHELR